MFHAEEIVNSFVADPGTNASTRFLACSDAPLPGSIIRRPHLADRYWGLAMMRAIRGSRGREPLAAAVTEIIVTEPSSVTAAIATAACCRTRDPPRSRRQTYQTPRA
jgi:hypothetical protein